ncbi:fused MFS/spermidine synthase [Brevundimonas goettingensis]|uniref:Fused MFS/spermidine synthase n=1 Tax=Brevundimonas goettingensis TaxID=2774190 RepID=A0A975GWJ9_9CAUL|nr:fused MFS/spermidine synthase [Brevundimonas goettingensis]QTC92741.1 fused MFS/spermidine synthase [Brevundimonas goettingensis]
MTDTDIDSVASEPMRNPAPVLFAVAIFTSAALVFVVQPMVTKLVLPMLGGSPSVWNTSMVFFQTALLAGYAYAHALQRLKAVRSQLAIHLALLLLAGLFLPLKISGLLGEPNPAAPIGWLLATLTLSVGAPFAVLSATAPLLQAWYARVRAGHADGQNPYVLYAASNLGSFLALLAYPVVIEPLMSLSGQRASWSGGYATFMLLIVALAWLVWRRRLDDAVASEPGALPASPAIPWREKAVLVLLAAGPSSMMLGVTAHLSTDVASAPFLWVIPLALYLLTFVIAFQNKPIIPLPITLMIAAAVGIVCIAFTASRSGNWAMMFGLHLSAFFFLALMCHQRLAARRPAPDRLTEFYLLMSLGGVVGGAFTALLAPVIFRTVLEYPLVLVLVGLARPSSRTPIRKWEVYTFVAAVLICLAPIVLKGVFDANWDLAWAWSRNVNVSMEQTTQLILMFAMIAAFMIRDRMPAYVIISALIAIVTLSIGRGYDWALTERSFFGVMRVADQTDDRLGGSVHVLMHGTTLHGAQPRDPAFACKPTLYYAPATPIGQVTQAVQSRAWGIRIGVVGQGSGAMAGYKRAEDRLTFFEIDPMVDRLSRDPKWFSFINGCAKQNGPGGTIDTVLGDARLSLVKQPAGTYDLLLIDAFSSDSVPTHLLTEEAIAGYLRLLKPTGVVILHLSNRNLDITGPAEAAARALKAPHLHQIYFEDQNAPDMAEASTEVLILSPTEEGLAEFTADRRWENLPDPKVRPWTDDYVNLFGSLWRHLKAQWEQP